MEKRCHSSGGDSTVTSTTSSGGGGSTSSNSSNSRDVYLKHLNKISHKISKPIRRPPNFDQNQNQNPLPPPPPPPPQQQAPPVALSQPPPQQHQPPVYNINKNDFRDVVQRLTGSPAHERFSTPPPIQPPKPPSSRLQRIRPPPLAQISNRPPPVAQISNPQTNALNPAGGGPTNAGFMVGQRQPLSPLPPFPAVHAAAESPISAYMRFLQSSISSSVPSPRWTNFHPPPPAQLQQQNIPPPSQPSMPLPQFPALPTSPLPFGCMPSPRSPYALLSQGLLLSPNGQLGFPQVPLSPTLPVPSPRWNGI